MCRRGSFTLAGCPTEPHRPLVKIKDLEQRRKKQPVCSLFLSVAKSNAVYWRVLNVLNYIYGRGTDTWLPVCGTDCRSALQNIKAPTNFGGLWLRLCHILYISKQKEIEDDFRPTLKLKWPCLCRTG